ncbi:MAG: Holliday junction branch migration protein RuvA [Clostridia bacterium]|nr:Holliday junction branch migration protein RuvA [Oscillospiraceae bacterium]MBQ7005231.1 Holliday junction branch migration protein RuvA [Clostridia bacterium]
MFYSLTGNIVKTGTGFVALECSGVAFRCLTSNQTLYEISGDKQATLYTYLNVREDALDLFGFSTEYELEWFKQLISVNGVGPKVALAILSELNPDNLALSISASDEKSICRAPGVGKKLAQRIILDLRDKVGNLSGNTVSEVNVSHVSAVNSMANTSEAVAALSMLGYSQSEASVAVSKLDPTLSTEALIRQALKLLSNQ